MRRTEYPLASHTIRYKPSRVEGYDYEIIDMMQGTSLFVTCDVVETLRKMDGKHSLIECFEGFTKTEARELLRIYNDAGLLFHRSRIRQGKKGILIRLFIPRKINNSLAVFVNRLLMFLPVPLMVLGCYLVKYYLPIFYDGYGGVEINGIANNIISILLTIIVHEYGHYCAAVATDHAYVCELGIGFLRWGPVAYTTIDDVDVRHKGKRAQIMAGGIQANIMLMGIFCFLLFIFPRLYPIILNVLFVSFITVIANMMMVEGYDGEKIVSSLLLKPGASIVVYSKNWLRNKGKRNACKNILLRKSISLLSVIIVIMRVEVVICLAAFGIILVEGRP